MAQHIVLPESARFTCQTCGRCCQGWAVPVDRATVDRLRRHDWGGDPFEAVPTAGASYRIKLVDGRCFFLDQENRCRIHTELSYEAKPEVCRSFPLTVLEVGGKQYARLSFWCPTVTANTGKPLDHQLRWVKETARQADRRTAPLMINEKMSIDPGDFDRVHQALRRFLRLRAVPVGDRLAASAALIRRLDRAAATEAVVDVQQVVRTAESDGPAILAAEARRGGRPSGGRRVLSLYLSQDRPGGRFATLSRLVSVLLFNSGLTRLSSRAVAARASWGQVRRVGFEPSAAGEDLLTRYLCTKLESRRYVAGEATLVTGFNLLLSAYAAINVLARMKAASEGRPACADEDLRQAVSAADLLVVEHPGLYQGAFHRRLTQAALGSSDLCGDLLAHIETARMN